MADEDDQPDPSAEAEPGTPGGAAAVSALLGIAVSALGGRRREGQEEMALAVHEAVDDGRHLLVQAGTGTGKSLGYLVPVVHHAVTRDEHVVVSTATLALQRQVMTRDLPLVADALASHLPRPPRVALLKGWQNYLCLHKVDGGYPADEQTLFDVPGDDRAGAADHPAPEAGAAGPGGRARGSLGEEVLRLRAWAEDTDSGDRDDLVPGVSETAWRQVSLSRLECLGGRCPRIEDCFPQRARELAKEADVVVTNHAMLGIAATGSPHVLPDHSVLVVDEAHELAERVTAQATLELSGPSVEQVTRLVRRGAGIPTPDLDAAGTNLALVLAGLPEGRFADGLPQAVHDAVASVRDAARTLLSMVQAENKARTSGGGPPAPADGGAKVALAAVLGLFEIADRMAGGEGAESAAASLEDVLDSDDALTDVVTTKTTAPRASGPRDVLWCARPTFGRNAGVARLHAAPLSVSGLIATALLGERTGVLTSATLALGGSFDPVARSVGLARAGDPTERAGWRGLDVGSPFDYPRQGILYVAARLPRPGREPVTAQQLDEIEALVRAAGGRTLGLFSSRRAAQHAAEAMRERLDVTVLLQGEDQLPTLVREFAEEETSCLFGTLSLWQGVDVPGPACSLVLIDRIPFPRPDDPVRSARAEAVDAAGGNGFMGVQATHAALLLAQGSGRLVRTDTDRGVVAVLDPRLATARYGTFLTRSLPPFWSTTDRAVATAALARLAALP